GEIRDIVAEKGKAPIPPGAHRREVPRPAVSEGDPEDWSFRPEPRPRRGRQPERTLRPNPRREAGFRHSCGSSQAAHATEKPARSTSESPPPPRKSRDIPSSQGA